MKKVFGLSVLVSLLALAAVIPAQASDGISLVLSNVHCDADANTISGHIYANDGELELGVVQLDIRNMNGSTDNTTHTPLYTGEFNDNWGYMPPEDLDIGDHIEVTVRLEPNGSDEILARDGAIVVCEGFGAADDFQAVPGGEPTPEIDDIQVRPQPDPAPSRLGFGTYRPQFYFN